MFKLVTVIINHKSKLHRCIITRIERIEHILYHYFLLCLTVNQNQINHSNPSDRETRINNAGLTFISLNSISNHVNHGSLSIKPS